MGYIQSRTALTEIDLDYMQECEHCGDIATVPSRIYTEHTLEQYVSLFGGRPIDARQAVESNEASKQAALRYLTHHVQWQRCTKCGLYGSKAVEMMRRSYPGFKRWRTLNKWLVWSLGCLPMLLFLGGIEAIVRGHVNDGIEMMFWSGMILAIVGVCGWLLTYNIADIFALRLRKVNDPGIVQVWLQEWQRHGRKAVEEFYDCRQRSDRPVHYGTLQHYRTKYDPVRLEWAIMTTMSYPQIIMRRLRREYER